MQEIFLESGFSSHFTWWTSYSTDFWQFLQNTIKNGSFAVQDVLHTVAYQVCVCVCLCQVCVCVFWYVGASLSERGYRCPIMWVCV